MAFKNRNLEEIGLGRVAIKLLDTGLAEKYHYYLIFPIKTSRKLRMK